MLRTATSLARRFRLELWAVGALGALVVAAWVVSSGLREVGDLAVPTAYLDSPQGQAIPAYAQARAASEGYLLPFRSKQIPLLAAPWGCNWSDWPAGEEFQTLALGALARMGGLFVGFNLMLLSGHVLAAWTFFFVARQQGLSRVWSLVGGAAFGLAPFLFAHAPSDLSVQQCWHVPLFIPVWRWLAEDEGIAFGSRRFVFSVVVAVIAGLQLPAFALAFLLVALAVALLAYLRAASGRAAAAAAVVIGSGVAALSSMQLDTWALWGFVGRNLVSTAGAQQWLELNGLKLADFFVPPSSHRFELLAEFGRARAGQHVLHQEGSYFGILGLVALVALGVGGVRAVLVRRWDRVPWEAGPVLLLWGFFSTGGLNLIFSVLGLPFHRTGYRIGIVILALGLIFFLRALSRWSTVRPRVALAAGVAALGVVWLDQIPAAPARASLDARRSQVAADREFAVKMEAALPEQAMVMQIPAYAFPEMSYPGLGVGDHFRPFLYTRELRFSFGGIKGRAADAWFAALGKMSFPDALRQIRRRGYQALYFNRNAFPDRGKSILETLAAKGFSQVIESRAGDLVCVPL